MKRICFILFFIMLTFCGVQAQDDNIVLIRVGNETVTKGDFIKAYQKNNLISEASNQDLRDYLDLYINYRLKVMEAESLKMDTSKSFQKELASYKNQSAQQYLVDTEVSDQILNEAFERSKYQIRASHILVRCAQNAAPKDTLAAYHKIMQIRDKIINGMNFNDAAVEYSEDESARDFINPQNNQKQRGNRGELGYFSVMELIYPFETAAYNTPVGQVSMPVRSQFGYHLIYVQDKVPAMAKIFVSQIFIRDSTALSGVANPEVKSKLREIQRQFGNGTASFSSLVQQFSEDLATKGRDGSMDPFAPNRRPGNYVYAAIHLEKGQISDPIPSTLGWHILRLDSIIYATVNDETKYMIKNRLARDVRSQKSRTAMIEKLKKEYNYQESGKKAMMKFFKKNLPETYFQSTRIAIDSLKGIEKLKPICTFADQSLSVVDFAHYISRFQGAKLNGTVVDFLEQIYPNFVQENMIRYENGRLIDKYPDYKDLVMEFHDGMLLYEINSKKVWNAAIQDSVGLENYYEKIKTQFPSSNPKDSVKYKPMIEVRAAVISQYQDYLEQQWIKELRVKYPVSVDEKVFETILKK